MYEGNPMAENRYEYRVVKGFAISSVFWAIVGLLIVILISLQLVYPQLNLTSWLTYGRLRPIHTNALIYVFTIPAAFNFFLIASSWAYVIIGYGTMNNRWGKMRSNDNEGGCAKCSCTVLFPELLGSCL